VQEKQTGKLFNVAQIPPRVKPSSENGKQTKQGQEHELENQEASARIIETRSE
jgi:hypothetical protein